jgi:tetratricopeptide (TPR) repeat protein
MSYAQEQRQLKRPDELQKLGQQAVPWMERHGRTVVYGTLGVGVLGLVISVTTHLGAKAELGASTDFGAALRVLDRDVNSTAAAGKTGDDAPFASEAEKDAALVAKLAGFRKANPGRRAAINAALPLAQALLRQGKPDEALGLVDEFLKGAEPTDPLRPAAYEARGYAFESQKKYDDALAAFGLLAAETRTDFLKGMGLYHRARVLELKGDLAGAARQFSEVEAAAGGSSAARLAKDRLALLAAQGVLAPVALAPAPGLDAGRF